MMRGIFAAPAIPKEAVGFYVEMLRKVRETPEWKKFMADGAFNATSMSGEPFVFWLERSEAARFSLMKEAGFLATR